MSHDQQPRASAAVGKACPRQERARAGNAARGRGERRARAVRNAGAGARARAGPRTRRATSTAAPARRSSCSRTAAAPASPDAAARSRLTVAATGASARSVAVATEPSTDGQLAAGRGATAARGSAARDRRHRAASAPTRDTAAGGEGCGDPSTRAGARRASPQGSRRTGVRARREPRGEGANARGRSQHPPLNPPFRRVTFSIWPRRPPW